MKTNELGHLTIGSMDTVSLANEYGTPLYLMDEDLIRENMRMYKSSIEKYYGGNGLVCYASKAFSCKQIYRVAKEEGIGIDVVSQGELCTALSVATAPSHICYHGNNKSITELIYAVENDVGRIVIDSFDEIDVLEEIACGANKIVTVLLRISPGIEAHTHEFIKTGGIDSQFGFAIETGDAMKAIKQVLSKQNLLLSGVHCHIGSQIFDLAPFEHAAEVMFGFIADVKNETGHVLHDLNLGGGFGIRYTDEDTPISYDRYMESVSKKLKEVCARFKMDLPFVIIEPGRSIVGSAGVTIYTIGGIKDVENVRKFVKIDGGMTDNIRYALYHAKYDFVVANKANEEKTQEVAIVGRCCESGDMLAKTTLLQNCKRGDYLAVLCTGAYNYSMSSNYNRVQKPPVIMISNGKAKVAVKRETIEDVMRNDI